MTAIYSLQKMSFGDYENEEDGTIVQEEIEDELQYFSEWCNSFILGYCCVLIVIKIQLPI